MLYSSNQTTEYPLNYRISSVKLSDDINVIEIGYNRAPKGYSQILRRNVYILHYVTEGNGVFCGKQFSENDCNVVVPNEIENISSDREHPYTLYWIMFEGSKVLDILKKCNLPYHNNVIYFNRTNECAKIIHNALFNMQPENEFEEAAIMNSVFYQILSLHFANPQPSVDVCSISKKVKQLINENYSNNITMNSISKKLGYSRNYLYTLFKKDYGISPQDYLLNLRINKAKELLITEQNLSINEVSHTVGYIDSLYFSRIFRRKTGISPSEYKKKSYTP